MSLHALRSIHHPQHWHAARPDKAPDEIRREHEESDVEPRSVIPGNRCLDDKRISLGKKETGARAALPIWLEFMQQGMQGVPVENFPNVVPLEKLAPSRPVQVDVPDTAPPADAAEQGLTETAVPKQAQPKPLPTPKSTAPAASPAAPSSTQLKPPAGPSLR